MDVNRVQDVETLIRMEYLEMRDLKLTSSQLRRLLAIPADTCEQALESLVSSGFLARTPGGEFLLARAWVP
jgi:DNA-binding IclR family transcriptional regulator